MSIGIPAETRPGEIRFAANFETALKPRATVARDITPFCAGASPAHCCTVLR